VTSVLKRRGVAAALFAAALLLGWQAAAGLGALPAYILSPQEILAALWDTVRDGVLLPAAGTSLQRSAAGFVLGTFLGVLFGLLAGVSRIAEDIVDTLVSLTYPLPKIALFPIVVIWLGYTDSARVLVIAISCFYPAFVNSLAGTQNIDTRLLWVARNAGASRVRAFRQVVLRAAMPSVVTGVRLSLALSFILTFATETLGAGRGGLGQIIDDGFTNLLYPLMWAGIAAFAILGFAADRALLGVSDRLLRGQRVEAASRG